MPRKILKEIENIKTFLGISGRQRLTQSWKIASCLKMIKIFIAKCQTPPINKLWLIKESVSRENKLVLLYYMSDIMFTLSMCLL